MMHMLQCRIRRTTVHHTCGPRRVRTAFKLTRGNTTDRDADMVTALRMGRFKRGSGTTRLGHRSLSESATAAARRKRRRVPGARPAASSTEQHATPRQA